MSDKASLRGDEVVIRGVAATSVGHNARTVEDFGRELSHALPFQRFRAVSDGEGIHVEGKINPWVRVITHPVHGDFNEGNAGGPPPPPAPPGGWAVVQPWMEVHQVNVAGPHNRVTGGLATPGAPFDDQLRLRIPSPPGTVGAAGVAARHKVHAITWLNHHELVVGLKSAVNAYGAAQRPYGGGFLAPSGGTMELAHYAAAVAAQPGALHAPVNPLVLADAHQRVITSEVHEELQTRYQYQPMPAFQPGVAPAGAPGAYHTMSQHEIGDPGHREYYGLHAGFVTPAAGAAAPPAAAAVPAGAWPPAVTANAPPPVLPAGGAFRENTHTVKINLVGLIGLGVRGSTTIQNLLTLLNHQVRLVVPIPAGGAPTAGQQTAYFAAGNFPVQGMARAILTAIHQLGYP